MVRGDFEPSAEAPAIQVGFVYENDAAEQRLVVSINRGREDPVVIWRTADPRLPKGAKAQGSATLSSFQRWAVRGRKASAEDWAAFAKIERQRAWAAQDRKALVRIKRRMRREAGSGVVVE